MKKQIHILIVLALISLCTTAKADWRIEYFDRAQELFKTYDEKEAELMIQFDPATAAFFEVWFPFQDSVRKIRRIAFLERIKNDPDSIDWNDPWRWVAGLESTERERELFGDPNSEFREEYKEFTTQKNALRAHVALFKIRNKVFDQHCQDFSILGDQIVEELYKLQCELYEKKLIKPSERASDYCSPPPLDPHLTNYDYNTVFSGPPYSEKKFASIELDISKEAVLEVLGEPMYIEEIDFLNCMLFSKEEYHIEPLAAKYHGIDSSEVHDHSAPFIAFWFSEDGKVIDIFNRNYIKDDQTDALIGMDKALIAKKFGEAKEELLIRPCYFFSYTKLKEGSYTGHTRGIFIRRIYFNNDNKVIRVESGEGPEHEIYSGIVSPAP